MLSDYVRYVVYHFVVGLAFVIVKSDAEIDIRGQSPGKGMAVNNDGIIRD